MKRRVASHPARAPGRLLLRHAPLDLAASSGFVDDTA